MKNLLALLAVLVSAISLHAQVVQVVVSGSVRDAETGEALAGASVYTKDYRYGQITDNAGFFELKAVKDETLNLHVSYVGYKTQTIKVKADRKRTVTIKLEHDNQLRDVTIYAPSEIGIRSSQMSANELSIRQIKSIPATLGEVDILKALQTLPGVQSGSDGTAGIYVRGGNYDQNQITIDGFPVYNPEHLKGFVSVFSPEMVSGVTIYKGGFPARYGSRLSSVVDVELKDGDFDRYHGSLTAGMMSSALHVEGPIWKGHTSFSVSGRASYLNAIVIPVMKHIIDNQDVLNPYLKLNYYDITARLAHRFSKRDRLTASFYIGNDKDDVTPSSWHTQTNEYFPEKELTKYFKSETENNSSSNWGNIVGGLTWIHTFSDKLQMRASAGYSQYRYNLSQSEKVDKSWLSKKDNKKDISLNQTLSKDSYAKYHSRIGDFTAKIDFTHKAAARNTLRYGVGATWQHFAPTVDVYDHSLVTTYPIIDDYSIKETLRDETIGSTTNSTTISVYAEDDWDISHWLKANIGLRYVLYSLSDHTAHSLEPRASVRFLPTDQLALKLSYARMSQGFHMLTSGNIVMPSDIWVPVTKRLPLMHSDQVAAGAGYEFVKGLTLEVEGYYKWMHNLAEYRDGASFLTTTGDWQNMAVTGRGRAYGAEVLLKKETGKTTGWLSYTWAKALRTFDRPMQELNGGREFPAANDRRHNLNIIIAHRFDKHWTVSASWTFRSGRRGNVATTVVSGGRIDEYDPVGDNFSSEEGIPPHDMVTYDPGNGTSFYRYSRFYTYRGRNSFRIPDEHHLDLRVVYTLRHRRAESALGLSLYNIYNHQNITDVYVSYDNVTAKPFLKGVCKLPFLPSVDYTIKF